MNAAGTNAAALLFFVLQAIAAFVSVCLFLYASASSFFRFGSRIRVVPRIPISRPPTPKRIEWPSEKAEAVMLRLVTSSSCQNT